MAARRSPKSNQALDRVNTGIVRGYPSPFGLVARYSLRRKGFARQPSILDLESIGGFSTQEAPMLTFDLISLSKTELETAISSQCSQFGTVKSVKVVPPVKHREYAIAIVAMSSVEESDKVVVKIGDMKFGTSAIIRLIQEEKPIPVSLKPADDSGLSISEQPGQRPVSRRRKRNSVARAKSKSGQPFEILLVEDNPADVRMTQEALQAAGVPHNLHVVKDGLEAISFLYRTRQFDSVPAPDLILLDLNIPKFNGHEVLNEIKANDSLKHILVVVLTCSKAQSDIDKSYGGDADYFLTKPAGLEAFAQEMKKVEALVAR